MPGKIDKEKGENDYNKKSSLCVPMFLPLGNKDAAALGANRLWLGSILLEVIE